MCYNAGLTGGWANPNFAWTTNLQERGGVLLVPRNELP